MNYRLISKILGALLMLVAAAMGLSAAYAACDSCPMAAEAIEALLISAGVTALAGVILLLCGMGRVSKFPRREGVAIVALGWLLSGLFGALPYILCPPYLDPAGAIFESVSGFTTTGSTVMTDIEAWPRGLLIWRSLTQWLGGLGILVLFVAVLSYFGLGGKTLFRNESSFQTGEADTARIRDTAFMLWRVYLLFTIICAVGLWAMGLEGHNAIMHAMTTVSTGGFSPHNASVGHYSSWGNGWLIELWFVLFMIIGSLNFLLWALLIKKRWKRLRDEEEGVWFLAVLFGFSLLIAMQLAWVDGVEESFWEAFRGALFSVTSVVSTSGFGTVDFELWPAFPVTLLLVAMMIGGCAGSTSGGLKVRRLILLTKSIKQEITHSYRPQKVLRMRVNGQQIDAETRGQVLMFVALLMVLLLVGTMVLSAIEAQHAISFDSALSATFATLFNIGPGFAEVGPTDNFGWMQPRTKLFLSLLMMLGRLELFVILALFMPGFWRRY